MTTEKQILSKYFPDLSDKQLKQFFQLDELYRFWNEKINVISRKDIDQLYLHHVLHSLSIAKVISFKEGTKIIDVGTGGGFPGIPLAIMFPTAKFLLIDSIGKKINVVKEISASLGLNNLDAVKSRAEEIDVQCDFVVSRAVATIDDLVKWTKHMIKPGGKNVLKNGWLLLKGGDLEDELKAYKESAVVFNVSEYFEEDFFETKKVVYLSD